MCYKIEKDVNYLLLLDNLSAGELLDEKNEGYAILNNLYDEDYSSAFKYLNNICYSIEASYIDHLLNIHTLTSQEVFELKFNYFRTIKQLQSLGE